MAKELIGILGGTFDPIHKGHIAVARMARESLHLDRVLILPTGNPPHKQNITPAEDRWRMVCAAVAPEEGLEACRMELDREGVIYTADTLRLLHQQYPKAELYYIIGADTLMELHTWHDFPALLGLCTFAICPRSTTAGAKELLEKRKWLSSLGGKFAPIQMEPINVSSTDLRQKLSVGAPAPMLPETVREYAGICGLYGMKARLPMASVWMPRLFGDLNLHRFSHTLAVAYTARHLAQFHGVDVWKAETAAFLHDCAKCLPPKEMQRICLENHLTEDKDILQSGALMHALAGAHLAKTVYGITDEDVLQAILSHTTGRPGMSRLDMIVFLADKIEPTRKPYPTLEKARMMAYLSLEKAMLTSLEGTRDYVKKGGKSVHPQSLETVAWLRGILGK